jgi:hypothetical protein
MAQCTAMRYNDGSWFCEKCVLSGDRDDDPEDVCPVLREARDEPEKAPYAPTDRPTPHGG